MLNSTYSIEFVKSRTGAWVPLVEGNLLHSSIDPEKEAKDQIDAEWADLKDVSAIVVLGLGGGFHIAELLSRKSFQIVVVESIKEIISSFEEKNPELYSKIEILGGIPAGQIAQESLVLHTMRQSFALFKHPASFRVSNFYYSAVLRAFSQRTINSLKQMANENLALNRFLDSLDISGDQFLTLPMIEEAMVRRGTGLDREGLIWMTMRELIT